MNTILFIFLILVLAFASWRFLEGILTGRVLAIVTRISTGSLVKRDRRTEPLEYWTHLITWLVIILIIASLIAAQITGMTLTDLWFLPISFFT